ncbi:MAG TPA: anti-sigma factor RsbA family regulatory protein [Pseudonocardiaceae bacterium]|nr:anti-sigma factor RsbA family regulatory protein [Pseudonocardiaceae bacterium]
MTASTAVTPFVHAALLYRGDTEYLTGIVPFVTAGLAAGEPVAVSVPPRQLALLRAELGSAAVDVRWLDMTEVGRNPGRIIPTVLLAFADAHPDRTVRVIGEPVWPLRTAHEYPACVQHEALINQAFASRSATILCPYDVARLREDAVVDAATTHPMIADVTGSWPSDRFAPDVAVASGNVPLAAPADASAYTVDSPDMTGLRQLAAEFAVGHGLADERVADLVLALTELASNSIEHAHCEATVLFGRDRAGLVCQVRDRGHITDPLAGRRPATTYQLRGRGLLLVNHLADLVRVHTVAEGTTVEIWFRLA